MKQLLEAGVHFGHQTRRWNPKMRPFIFQARNGIHILDLQQAVIRLNEAYKFITSVTASGDYILFVGTKKQAQEAIREEAERAGQFYVNQRWLGGMLTNFQTIQARIRYMKDLEARKEAGEFDRLTKKEAQHLEDELERLNRTLGGIRNMRRLPGAVFVIDTRKEHTAVQEARRLEIPVVALADTNCDPDEMDYPIPSNDDAIRAVKLLASKIADAAIEGRRQYEAGRDRGETGRRPSAAPVTLEEFGPEPGTPAAANGAAPVAVAAPETPEAPAAEESTTEESAAPETDTGEAEA